MLVIGFFRDVMSQFSGLIMFITTPLGELNSSFSAIPLLSNFSIINLLGIGLITTLIVLLGIHAVRLFIGG